MTFSSNNYVIMFLNNQKVAEMAHWEDEQIEYLKEKVSEEGKLEDLKKGKPPEQVGHFKSPTWHAM